jgi:hypothetical protein
MKRTDQALILILVCSCIGFFSGYYLRSEIYNHNNKFDKQRKSIDSLLVLSRKKQDSLLKITDSLTKAGIVIVEKIKKIPVYVYVPYDTMGSQKLRQLMIQEYKKSK